jgi:Fic family protein
MLKTLRLIGEYKGKQELYKNQSREILEMLRQTAIIQSTESSNRIEGITAPHKRIQELLSDKTTPRNRSEQEIVGYRLVLDAIHTNHQRMLPFNAGLVRQLHRDMYSYSESDLAGKWKPANNEITEILADGTKVTRFQPPPAHMTEILMHGLHDDLNTAWLKAEIEPLLLISSYVLDFLCIHPFADGNGRMARLLSLLLLYSADYDVGKYISLEKIIESTKESYYDTIQLSSKGWHEGKHDIMPWFEYFVGVVLLAAYRSLEERVGVITSAKGAKTDMVKDVIRRLPHSFKISDVYAACPRVSPATINRTLHDLKEQKLIRCIKKGRDAEWVKARGAAAFDAPQSGGSDAPGSHLEAGGDNGI